MSHGLLWGFHAVGSRHVSCLLPPTPRLGWPPLRVAAAPQACPAAIPSIPAAPWSPPGEASPSEERAAQEMCCLVRRFLFILLGPRAEVKAYHEVGRAMATLLTDEVSLVQHPWVGWAWDEA